MPEPRIPLDQWRALVAVVEKGGYAKAAAALHKSQSSVTYGVQQLESQLGVKAFKIAGRRAELTPTGELLYRRARYLLAAHPEHPLHQLSRKLSLRDLRPYRHLVVRESSPERASAPSMETTQRWTFSHLATSIEAARSGYGFAWLPEEKIRQELAAGTLKPLPMREGGERFAELYLIFADREHAGPATLRLAEIIREAVASECTRSAHRSPTRSSPRLAHISALAPRARDRSCDR